MNPNEMSNSVVKIENIYLQINYHGYTVCNSISVLMNKELTFENVTCIAYDEDVLMKTALLQLFTRKYDNQSYFSCQIDACVYYNGVVIKTEYLKSFLPPPIIFNQNNTVLESLHFVATLYKSKIDIKELIATFEMADDANKRLYGLSKDQLYCHDIMWKILSMPIIISCYGFEDFECDFNFRITRIISLCAKKYNSIFVILVDQEIRDEISGVYRYIDVKAFVAKMDLINRNERLEMLHYYMNTKRFCNVNDNNSANKLNEALDLNINSSIETSIYIKNLKARHNKYYQKVYDLCPCQRLMSIGNCTFKISQVCGLVKILCREYLQKQTNIIFHFLLILLYLFAILFLKKSSNVKNDYQNTGNVITASLKCIMCSMRKKSFVYESGRKFLVAIYNVIITPLFNDYFLSTNDQSELVYYDRYTLYGCKFRLIIIYTMQLKSILIFCRNNASSVRLNMHILFTPGSYVFSLLLSQVCCNWIPILIIHLVFRLKTPILIMFISSMLSITISVLRFYCYEGLRKEYVFYIISGVIVALTSSDVFCFDEKKSLMYYTRKINPLCIALNLNFVTGKLWWKFAGYSVRNCIYMYIFSVYHLSKLIA